MMDMLLNIYLAIGFFMSVFVLFDVLKHKDPLAEGLLISIFIIVGWPVGIILAILFWKEDRELWKLMRK